MTSIGNITFSYFDQVYKQIKENNLINVLVDWKTIIIYFDQTDIPTTISPLPPLLTPELSSITRSSFYDAEYNLKNVTQATIMLVEKKYNPPILKPYKFVFDSNKNICIYLNGYLTQFLPDLVFSPIYYDINHNKITNNNLRNITKIVILNPLHKSILSPNVSYFRLFILTNEPLTNVYSCNNSSELINIKKSSCFPPNTQLTWVGNPDALIADYSKPYLIFKLYDANNNEIANNPENYSKVTQIAYYMSDTPGPYPPSSNLGLILGLVFGFLFFFGLGIGIYFYVNDSSLKESSNKLESNTGGYFMKGE